MKNSICERLHIPEDDDWLCEAGKDCKNKECKWYKKNIKEIVNMNPNTGKIRFLGKFETPHGKEVGFNVGEKVIIDGCHFEIISIQPDPENLIMLKGIPCVWHPEKHKGGGE